MKSNITDNYNNLTLRNGFFVSEKLQKSISECRLIFVGTGLASTVATSAARLGFNHFVLVDGDIVERSNLNRQDFTINDLGVNKAKAISERIKLINESATTEVIQKYISPLDVKGIVEKGDIVINCADFNEVVYEIDKEVSLQNKISISPLNIGFGSIVTVFDRKSAKLSEMTKGVTDSDKKFLLNFYSSLKGYKLPKYVQKNLLKAFVFISRKGFFPQNVIAAETSTILILSTILRYLDGKKICSAPVPISLDVERIYE